MRMKEDQNSIQIGAHAHTLADIHFFHIEKKRTKNYNLPLEFANTNEYDEMRLEQKISFSNPSVGFLRCLRNEMSKKYYRLRIPSVCVRWLAHARNY